MRAMADSGCLELRFGIESGSDRVLSLIKKGFTAAESLALIPRAIEIFPRCDAFYVWGFRSRPWTISTSRSSRWSRSG